jgi:UDP-N-acetylglucosamine--N-acetylmuramyl-(pentapeptide) pyrophosphoryl-undecaprenol N-acetylglucosamine transferase
VVGFGVFVAGPAYLAARGRVPVVVHEANARAGMANRLGARVARRVLAAVPGLVGVLVRKTPLTVAVAVAVEVWVVVAAPVEEGMAQLGMAATGPLRAVLYQVIQISHGHQPERAMEE